jgi:hypothetical protein
MSRRRDMQGSHRGLPVLMGIEDRLKGVQYALFCFRGIDRV